jgi:hypothetical protein
LLTGSVESWRIRGSAVQLRVVSMQLKLRLSLS